MNKRNDAHNPAESEDIFDQAFLARLERLHLIAKRTGSRAAESLRRSRRIGDGLEFADHRAYAPGDDIRFVDWPYFARMDKLLLRTFHEHSEADVTILLDRSNSMAPAGKPAKLNYARETAAALTYVAMGGPRHVNIIPFSDRLSRGMSSARNRAGVPDVLRFLRAVEPTGDTRLDYCAEQFARRSRSAGTVIILSDLLDCAEQLSPALGQLKLAGHDVSVIHLISPQDSSPDMTGPILLTQAEGSSRHSVNATPALMDSYKEQWAQFCRDCHRTCLGREAIYVSAPIDVPFDRLILQTLCGTGVLGA